MADSHNPPARRKLSVSQRLEIDGLCTDFDRAWREQSEPPRISEFLTRAANELRPELLRELLRVELEYRRGRGEAVLKEPYLAQFAEFTPEVEHAFAARASDENATAAFLPVVDATSQAAMLVELIQQYRAESAVDPTLNPGAWAAKYPELAEPLERALQGLEGLRRAATIDGTNGPQRLGDFVIIREIGRGGMGAVFEAEQKSLGRRVALKVLWFSTVSDVNAVQRFQREAETVARLHHTNIVPIYSVGSEGAVNYFAMQLIDGQGLDQIIKSRPRGVDSATAVTWGLQAAEALAHAHQRGVIHRDVKPSNLLLDREGQIWLSDFGLAKRSDDVTLSMAGALMGTPRYMSPEQASASTRNVDHRSDIYSLGATLYELVTGRPVHDGSTPHGVISQILSAEIVSPRKYQPDIPRDLETVLMKCLNKQPENRYASADDLVSDLRAIQESRPIQARRTGPVEQLQKWFTRHHRIIKWVGGSIGATVAVIAACWLGRQLYWQVNASQLRIDSTDGNYVAELFDEQGVPVVAPLSVPMQTATRLPAGDYRLRLAAEGYLSQDACVSLTAQAGHELDASLKEQFACDPIASEYDVAFVKGGQQTLRIAYNEDRIQIVDHSGPDVDLPWSLVQDAAALGSPGWRWPLSEVAFSNKFDKFELRPWILPEGDDLNGDGQTDFVVAFRHQGCVAALGKSGVVWFAGRSQDLAQPAPQPAYPVRGVRSAVVQPPQWVPDVDTDGKRDLLICFAEVGLGSLDISRDELSRISHRWLEVISGATGATIWRYDFPPELFRLPEGVDVPLHASWFVGTLGNNSGGHTSVSGSRTVMRRTLSTQHTPAGSCLEVPMIFVDPLADPSRVIVASCSRVQALDLATGSPAQPPVATGVVACQPPLLCALTGDRQPQLLLACELSGGTSPALQNQVSAWSIAQQKMLWTRRVDRDAAARRSSFEPPPPTALIEDLDADGKPEVVLPCESSNAKTSGTRFPWGTLEVLNGSDGKPRWSARVYNCDSAADRFAIGPDVDGDQVRDVFVASLWGQCDQLVVECRSGQDGTLRWIQSQPLPPAKSGTEIYVVQPVLWNAGSDGWPQLVVTLRSDSSSNRKLSTWLFSTRDGHVAHLATGYDEVRVADTDDDRVEDLCLVDNPQPRSLQASAGIRMSVVRGVASEPIRQLGVSTALAATDMDGDGLQDCLLLLNGSMLQARSAATGKTLWQIPNDVYFTRQSRLLSWESSGARLADSRLWDFDNDGVRDLVFDPGDTGWRTRLSALSGKSGRIVCEFDFTRQSRQGSPRMEIHDLDHDGKPELVCYGFSDWEIDRRGGYDVTQGRLCLTVFSAIDGRVKWRARLGRQYGTTNNPPLKYRYPDDGHLEYLISDQNGDGVQDIIVFAEPNEMNSSPNALTLRCCSGRDGSTLWQRAAHSRSSDNSRLFSTAPTMSLLAANDSQKPASVMMLEIVDAALSGDVRNGSRADRYAVLHCLDLDGQDKWVSQFAVPNYFAENIDRRGALPVPVALRAINSATRIAINLPGADGKAGAHRLVLLNEHGEEVGELDTDVENRSSNYSLTPIDANRDGEDELLLWGTVHSANCLRWVQVWNEVKVLRQIFCQGDCNYMDIVAHTADALPESASNPHAANEVIVVDRAARWAIAVDLEAGKILWRCLGPRKDGFDVDPPAAQVLYSQSPCLPHVLFNFGGQVACRTAKTSDGLPTLSRQAKPIQAPIQDPRLVRKLPRVEQMYDAVDGGILPTLLAQAMGSLALIVLPGWQLGNLIKRRRWNIRSLLLSFVIVAVALVVLIAPPVHYSGSNSNPPLGFVLAMAAIGAPVWIFLGAALRWIWHARYRTVAVWLGIALVASCAWGVAGPGWSPVGQEWEPGERLSLDGCYLLLLDGIWTCSYLYLIWWIVSPVAVWCQGWRKHPPTPRPLDA